MRLLLRSMQSIAFLPAHLFMMLVCWVFAPFIVPFASKEGYLPKWLNWFQTPDNPIDGEGQFDDDSQYIRRVKWLWRNPAYGFAWSVLAADIPVEYKCYVYGDLSAKENPYKPGWTFLWVKETGHFCFRLFLPTFKGKCLKARFGWKLRAKALGSKETKCKYVITFNPTKDRDFG